MTSARVFVLPIEGDDLIKAMVHTKHVEMNLGAWEGLPVIAVGPKGGKIVGYKADGSVIYAGSKGAKKLAAQKKLKQSGTSVVSQVGEWLLGLGFPSKIDGDEVKVSKASAKMIAEHFSVSPESGTSAYDVFSLKKLADYVGEPMKPQSSEALVWAAGHAAGDDQGVFPDSLGKLKPVTDSYEVSKVITGGSHGDIKLFKDSESGKYWLFKFKDPTIGRAEEASARIGRLIAGDLIPATKFVELNGQPGALIQYVPGQALNDASHSNPPSGILKKKAEQVVMHQVADWLSSQHDGHAGNFKYDTESGNLYGIDKGQAFKFLGKDKLTPDFAPNNSKQIYIKFWKMVGEGTIPLETVVAGLQKALTNASQITPDQLKGIAAPYMATAAAHLGWDQSGIQYRLNILGNRLQTLKEDFESLIKKATGKTVKLKIPDDNNFDTMPEDTDEKEEPAPQFVIPDSPEHVTDTGSAEEAIPGWPKHKKAKSGEILATIHHPGTGIPAGVHWAKGYPGPGFKATITYGKKGGKKEQYEVEFIVGPNDSIAVKMKYPNGQQLSWPSPAKAADSMKLYVEGLSLYMSSTDKKFKAAFPKGIAYPAAKAFGISEFKDELLAIANGDTKLPMQAQTVDELEESGIVESTQKEITAVDILNAEEDGIISDMAALPPDIADSAMAESGNTVSSNWGAAIPPGVVVKTTIATESGAHKPLVLIGKLTEDGTAGYEVWMADDSGKLTAMDSLVEPASFDGAYGFYDDPELKVLSIASQGAEEPTVAETVGAPPVAVIPDTAIVPDSAPTSHKGPLPIGTQIKVTKAFPEMGKQAVTLSVLGDNKFSVTIDTPDGPKVDTFDSLSSACNWVWFKQKGYEDLDDYKSQTGDTKPKSGAGWGFWGISAKTKKAKPWATVIPAAVSAAPVSGAVESGESNWASMPEMHGVQEGEKAQGATKWLAGLPDGSQVQYTFEMNDTEKVYVATKVKGAWLEIEQAHADDPNAFGAENTGLAHDLVSANASLQMFNASPSIVTPSVSNFETMPGSVASFDVMSGTKTKAWLDELPEGAYITFNDNDGDPHWIQKTGTGPNDWEIKNYDEDGDYLATTSELITDTFGYWTGVEVVVHTNDAGSIPNYDTMFMGDDNDGEAQADEIPPNTLTEQKLDNLPLGTDVSFTSKYGVAAKFTKTGVSAWTSTTGAKQSSYAFEGILNNDVTNVAVDVDIGTEAPAPESGFKGKAKFDSMEGAAKIKAWLDTLPDDTAVKFHGNDGEPHWIEKVSGESWKMTSAGITDDPMQSQEIVEVFDKWTDINVETEDEDETIQNFDTMPDVETVAPKESAKDAAIGALSGSKYDQLTAGGKFEVKWPGDVAPNDFVDPFKGVGPLPGSKATQLEEAGLVVINTDPDPDDISLWLEKQQVGKIIVFNDPGGLGMAALIKTADDEWKVQTAGGGTNLFGDDAASAKYLDANASSIYYQPTKEQLAWTQGPGAPVAAAPTPTIFTASMLDEPPKVDDYPKGTVITYSYPSGKVDTYTKTGSGVKGTLGNDQWKSGKGNNVAGFAVTDEYDPEGNQDAFVKLPVDTSQSGPSGITSQEGWKSYMDSLPHGTTIEYLDFDTSDPAVWTKDAMGKWNDGADITVGAVFVAGILNNIGDVPTVTKPVTFALGVPSIGEITEMKLGTTLVWMTGTKIWTAHKVQDGMWTTRVAGKPAEGYSDGQLMALLDGKENIEEYAGDWTNKDWNKKSTTPAMLATKHLDELPVGAMVTVGEVGSNISYKKDTEGEWFNTWSGQTLTSQETAEKLKGDMSEYDDNLMAKMPTMPPTAPIPVESGPAHGGSSPQISSLTEAQLDAYPVGTVINYEWSEIPYAWTKQPNGQWKEADGVQAVDVGPMVYATKDTPPSIIGEVAIPGELPGESGTPQPAPIATVQKKTKDAIAEDLAKQYTTGVKIKKSGKPNHTNIIVKGEGSLDAVKKLMDKYGLSTATSGGKPKLMYGAHMLTVPNDEMELMTHVPVAGGVAVSEPVTAVFPADTLKTAGLDSMGIGSTIEWNNGGTKWKWTKQAKGWTEVDDTAQVEQPSDHVIGEATGASTNQGGHVTVTALGPLPESGTTTPSASNWETMSTDPTDVSESVVESMLEGYPVGTEIKYTFSNTSYHAKKTVNGWIEITEGYDWNTANVSSGLAADLSAGAYVKTVPTIMMPGAAPAGPTVQTIGPSGLKVSMLTQAPVGSVLKFNDADTEWTYTKKQEGWEEVDSPGDYKSGVAVEDAATGWASAPMTLTSPGAAPKKKAKAKKKITPPKKAKKVKLDPVAEAKKKLAKDTAEWAKNKPAVTSDKALHVLAHLQKQLPGVEVWARMADAKSKTKITIGSDNVALMEWLHANNVKHTMQDTPLGAFATLTITELQKALPESGTIKGDDGKDYPVGTKFKKKKTITKVKALVEASDGFYKFKTHKTDDTMVVLKVSGTGETQKNQIKKMCKDAGLDYQGIGAPNGEPIVGSGNVIVSVKKADLEKTGKTETHIEPALPDTPPAFNAKPLPSVMASTPWQKAPNVDALYTAQSQHFGQGGNALKAGALGVFRDAQLRVRRVKQKDGKIVTEISGALLNQTAFKHNTSLESGIVEFPMANSKKATDANGNHLSTGYGNKIWEQKYDPATGIVDETLKAKGHVTVDNESGYNGTVGNGTTVQVHDGKQVFKGMFRVRVEDGQDIQTELAAALEAMGVDASDGLASHSAEDERILKKWALVRSEMGAKGWQLEYGGDMNIYNEKWLDTKMKSLKIAQKRVDKCEFRETMQGHISVVENDGERIAKKGWKAATRHDKDWKSLYLQIKQGIGWASRKAQHNNGAASDGWSSGSDVNSGGADSNFFRVSKSLSMGNSHYIMLHPRVFMRLDYRHYTQDAYGSVFTGGASSAIKHSSSTTGTEICFNGGATLADVMCVSVPNSEEKKLIIDALNKDGITEVNGVSLDDFIIVGSVSEDEIHESLRPKAEWWKEEQHAG